jgi:hypothetical protein
MAWTTWRDDCRPIIAEVIQRVGTTDPRALRAALLEAYPYGQRSMHPYKIWRDEIRRQLSPPATAIRRRMVPGDAPGQLSLLQPPCNPKP